MIEDVQVYIKIQIFQSFIKQYNDKCVEET